jgi:hypothetical protein
MVVDKRLAEDVVDIFKELYDKKYPIEKVRLIDEYNADDNLSMNDNNSSAFCYRTIKGSNKISNHGKGMAIDINPFQNPHVIGETTNPVEAYMYSDRTIGHTGIIIEGDDCYNYLEETVSDSGRLIKGKYRGAGRPCFIYFTRNSQTNKLDWDEVVSDISVQKDSASSYLNRITFRIVIPAQSSGTGAIGEYNPFNGYTFKQVGLFNDAKFNTAADTAQPTTPIAENMPCGMMLAVKNIQNFTKTADESIEFTWTLTI